MFDGSQSLVLYVLIFESYPKGRASARVWEHAACLDGSYKAYQTSTQRNMKFEHEFAACQLSRVCGLSVAVKVRVKAFSHLDKLEDHFRIVRSKDLPVLSLSIGLIHHHNFLAFFVYFFHNGDPVEEELRP